MQVKYLFGYTGMASANHHGNPPSHQGHPEKIYAKLKSSVIIPQIGIAFGGFLLVIREILWCDGWILGCCFLPGDFYSFAIFSLNADL